jgi:hypothetical protein
MPLSINVGLNRKASADFQSTGASINITAELDATLLMRPDDLQAAIGRLYQQARTALERQAATPVPAPTLQRQRVGGWTNRREAPTSGNGHSSNGRGPQPMTPKQRQAILAIARRADVDAFASARQTFSVDLDALTARQASQLIDNLKGS